jgi:hypothetical protein
LRKALSVTTLALGHVPRLDGGALRVGPSKMCSRWLFLAGREELLEIAASGPLSGAAASLALALAGLVAAKLGVGSISVEPEAFQDSLVMGILGESHAVTQPTSRWLRSPHVRDDSCRAPAAMARRGSRWQNGRIIPPTCWQKKETAGKVPVWQILQRSSLSLPSVHDVHSYMEGGLETNLNSAGRNSCC